MINQTFTIKGMHCEACTKLTTKRIRAIEGVSNVSVDLESRSANVESDRPVTAEEINAVLVDSSYKAEEK